MNLLGEVCRRRGDLHILRQMLSDNSVGVGSAWGNDFGGSGGVIVAAVVADVVVVGALCWWLW